MQGLGFGAGAEPLRTTRFGWGMEGAFLLFLGLGFRV